MSSPVLSECQKKEHKHNGQNISLKLTWQTFRTFSRLRGRGRGTREDESEAGRGERVRFSPKHAKGGLSDEEVGVGGGGAHGGREARGGCFREAGGGGGLNLFRAPKFCQVEGKS